MTDWLIEGARVLLPSGLEEAAVRTCGDRIAEVGAPSAEGARRIDGRGLILAPALTDLHGDAFERQVSPRPGVLAPAEVAVLDTDRQLAAAGIATACHALTLSWEPGLRSVAQGELFLDALDAARPRLGVEYRVQLRWEVFAVEALPLIARALAGPATPTIAFNDDASMMLRRVETPLQTRPFEFGPRFSPLPFDDPRLPARLAGAAQRAGRSPDAYLARFDEVWERRPQVPEIIAEVAAQGRAAGAPMLSHDDASTEARDFWRGLGARVSEFPMNLEVARAARDAGDAIVFGAPNAMRGGSHLGSLSAPDMIEAGLCDALASDCHYPSMLAAVARLHAERRAPLPELWARVSAGPARAMGLTDRGEIAAGMRADLVLVDWPEGAAPAAAMTLSAGRIAHLSADLIG